MFARNILDEDLLEIAGDHWVKSIQARSIKLEIEIIQILLFLLLEV